MPEKPEKKARKAKGDAEEAPAEAPIAEESGELEVAAEDTEAAAAETNEA